MAEYRKVNRVKLLAQMREYKKANREKVNLQTLKYRKDSAHKVERSRQEWRDKNPNYKKIRWASDPQFRLKECFSHRIRQALKAVGNRKNYRASLFLGCSLPDFRAHLERQFQPGMTWDNYGFCGWQVDHIRPCASFDLSKIEDQKMCFHYLNLQPLWARDNRQKSDSYEKN